MLAAAGLMASSRHFGSAFLLAGIAMFFVIVTRMVTFESRYKIGKTEPGEQQASRITIVKKMWKVPGFEGKFYVIFLAVILSLWLLQNALVLIKYIAK